MTEMVDESNRDSRAQSAMKNRWTSLLHNPKLMAIALFASYVSDNLFCANGWPTSMLQLGGILGSLSAGVLGEIFSQTYTMFSACCWVVLGSYLYCGASYHKPGLLYAGRFFTGLGSRSKAHALRRFGRHVDAMVLAGIIVAKFGNDSENHSNTGWAAMAFIWIYVGAFGATWGPVSWTPVAEIFPLSVRSKGSSFGASSNWIWFFLPETKGATLEEMDRVFKSRSGETDMILLDEARRDVAIAHDATLEIEKERVTHEEER
ncbi:hypothetical protein N7508_010582, partial [Penicillium antarcticum]|uniref:uncharacterized protein n=1 Tax=Penicillium antarcticum TaxID=416450 RepID=UPI0023943C3E